MRIKELLKKIKRKIVSKTKSFFVKSQTLFLKLWNIRVSRKMQADTHSENSNDTDWTISGENIGLQKTTKSLKTKTEAALDAASRLDSTDSSS